MNDMRYEFTLAGRDLTLTADQVERSVAQLVPEPVRTHEYVIDKRSFPPLQVLEAATGVPRDEYRSASARRILEALGFESRQPPTVARGSHAEEEVTMPVLDGAWHTEAAVQAALVNSLADGGWTIIRVADTAAREHGVDVIAERSGRRVGIEVKGYPSAYYADAARAHLKKSTSPSTQARHWFAVALHAAMRLRQTEPSSVSSIALPDRPRYRSLVAEVAEQLTVLQVIVLWVSSDGTTDLRTLDHR